MVNMLEHLAPLAAGSVFGLAGGVTPGPTTTIVVAQTIRFSFFNGLEVAIALLLTDAPTIILSVLLVGQLARFESVLGVITLLGAGIPMRYAWLGGTTWTVGTSNPRSGPSAYSTQNHRLG
jgi:threonine/homoserine/homoserine lactone efflux protein